MINNNSTKVLLVDTSFAALPIYNYLVGMGFDVYVMGNRQDDVLAKKAGSNWIEQDYSKVDEVEVQIDILGIEFLVPGCTDVSFESCVALKEGMTIDTHQANKTLSNKLSFRGLCGELGLPSPKVVKLEDFPKSGFYICKPVDSFSGRGISIFDGREYKVAIAAYQAAEKVSPSSTAVIESYVKGQLYSYSAFLENHRVISSFLVKEGSSATPFAVDTSYVVGSLPGESRRILQTSIESISKHLQLKDGLIHTQFIFDGNAPILVEMSRRCPGDLYSLLIEYSTGFEYAAKYASYFVSQSYKTKKVARHHVLRHTVTSDDNVVFGEFEFCDQQPVKAYYPLQTVGRSLLARQLSRVGILFSEYESNTELIDNYDRFIQRNAYIVQ